MSDQFHIVVDEAGSTDLEPEAPREAAPEAPRKAEQAKLFSAEAFEQLDGQMTLG